MGLVPALLLAGCSTLTRVERVEVPVTVIQSCVTMADIPAIPASPMPPEGSNIERLAAGASAYVRELMLYAQRTHGMLVTCAGEGGMSERMSGRGYTHTADGDVWHRLHPRTGLEMPVRLATREVVLNNAIPEKVKRGRRVITDSAGNAVCEKAPDGRLVYALPGGGRFVFPAKP